ncbi:MAG: TlpA family protein disulfide reductase [Elusimicrobia bacterium]|nr:TlpA family protein disulfide reductase [Elusimicrobiota bacterium]
MRKFLRKRFAKHPAHQPKKKPAHPAPDQPAPQPPTPELQAAPPAARAEEARPTPVPWAWLATSVLLGAAAGVLAYSLLARPAASRGGDRLPDIRLQTLSLRTAPSLAACPTATCLTIYVAPWCGYCRQGTPTIIALKKLLKKNGVTTRIIVGMDAMEAVRAYAADFGPDTLLDPDSSFRVSGVPHFLVSDASGAISKRVPGLPPYDDPESVAGYLGLPNGSAPASAKP